MLRALKQIKRKEGQKWWEIAAASLAVLCVALTVVPILHEGLMTWTLSFIGESEREWFLVFSVVLSVAFSVNLKLFLRKVEEKETTPLFDFLILLNIPLAISQALIIDPRVATFHIVLAASFTAHSILLATFFITFNARKSKKRGLILAAPLISMMFAAGVLNLYMTIVIHNQLIAIYQLILIYSMIIAIFSLQFFSKYHITPLDKKKKYL